VKIINAVGARPQFIKYAPVSKALQRVNGAEASIQDILVHTGQHYDYNMSKIFFDELGIKDPDYHLDVGSGDHGRQTALILQRIEEIYLREKPDMVVVYGDTNSTIGSALAAAKLHIPVAHVEAGLRSFNKSMPEEINRVLTDHSASALLCPTEVSVHNLQDEGFNAVLNSGKLISDDFDYSPYRMDSSNPLVINVGDVMFDSMLYALRIAEKTSDILTTLNVTPKEYCVLTVHRAENTDDPERLRKIITFINSMSDGKEVLFPIHPRTKKMYDTCGTRFSRNVRVIDPVGYFDLLMLVQSSALVMTDSGGLQKEAYWLKAPCITLRRETEWVETVASGWNILYRNYEGTHTPSDIDGLLYGDGKASERIVKTLINTVT
jgi:UDP-GlcNAc3NAcA epimerase